MGSPAGLGSGLRGKPTLGPLKLRGFNMSTSETPIFWSNSTPKADCVQLWLPHVEKGGEKNQAGTKKQTSEDS